MKFSSLVVIALECIHAASAKTTLQEELRATVTDIESEIVGFESRKLKSYNKSNRALKVKKETKGTKGTKDKHTCSTDDNPERTEVLKSAIFDPPTGIEMDKIKARMAVFDFSDEGDNISLASAPLAGPDRSAISKLFGNESLATAQKTSPDAIWGGIQTTYISRIDTLAVPKAEAVAYLFEEGVEPDRYAQVNIAFGSLPKPKFVEYKIGPLNVNVANMIVSRLSDIDQVWGSRPREGNEMNALKTMVDYILNEDELSTICSESFAGKTHSNGLNNHELAPPGLIGAERKTKILINFAIDGTWRGKDLNVS